MVAKVAFPRLSPHMVNTGGEVQVAHSQQQTHVLVLAVRARAGQGHRHLTQPHWV